ncbi:MAG: hypothetical protein DRI65_07580, partial [Chloroflexota bacterium]
MRRSNPVSLFASGLILLLFFVLPVAQATTQAETPTVKEVLEGESSQEVSDSQAPEKKQTSLPQPKAPTMKDVLGV